MTNAKKIKEGTMQKPTQRNKRKNNTKDQYKEQWKTY